MKKKKEDKHEKGMKHENVGIILEKEQPPKRRHLRRIWGKDDRISITPTTIVSGILKIKTSKGSKVVVIENETKLTLHNTREGFNNIIVGKMIK